MVTETKISKTRPSHTIYAAGAVLYRKNENGTIEIALIHRGKYNDWSLPKGKLDKGESILEAAWRELKEETGYDIAIRGYLRKVVYYVPAKNVHKYTLDHRSSRAHATGDRRKNVYYWAAEVIGGNFIANDEVDTLIWTTPQRAAQLISYPLDHAVLKEFAQFPVHARPIALIRHAKAGERLLNPNDDQLRTLDKTGINQAKALSHWLDALNVGELYAANKVRCVSTLEPYAVKKELGLTISAKLADEYVHQSPTKALQSLRDICQKHHASASIPAICSQGNFIPEVLNQWIQQSKLSAVQTQSRKGSLWLISVQSGKMVRAHYLPDPLAHPLS